MDDQAVAQQIYDYFFKKKGYRLGGPASSEDVALVERQLGRQLPPVLREMYLRFNGLFTPHNVPYLGPLWGEHMNPVYYTHVLHTYFEGIDLTSYIGFGMTRAQVFLATTWEGDRFIAYQGYMEEPQDLGT